jgi:hypothetical protein
MRTGDTVLHIPSGETWSVALVDGDDVISRGWPLSRARVADCAVTRECNDAMHEATLISMASMNDASDPRCAYAQRVCRENNYFRKTGT